MHKDTIDAWLGNFLEQSLQAAESRPAHHALLREISVLIERGGKRSRPILFLTTYKGYDGGSLTEVLPIAGALELLHAFLLIHDDIIDRDDKRWGGPNISGVCFEKYNALMPAREAMHQANAQALLAGDICQVLAQQAIITSAFSAQVKVDVLEQFAAVTQTVLAGELADLTFSNQTSLPTSVEIMQMYEDKTAKYSFVLPLYLGATLASAASDELKILTKVGKLIGVAYQLRDDVLGMFGNEQQLGKPNLSDLREGKMTLLMATALESANSKQYKHLKQLLGSQTAGSAELKEVQDIIVETGARKSIEQQITSLTEQALELLKTTSMRQKEQSILRMMAQNMAARNR